MKSYSNSLFTLAWTCDGSEPFSAVLIEKSILLKACYDGQDSPQLSQYCGASGSNEYESGFLGHPSALLNWEINPTSWLHFFSGSGIAVCMQESDSSIVLNRKGPGFQFLYYSHFARSSHEPTPRMQHFIEHVIGWLDFIETQLASAKETGFFWAVRFRRS